MAFVNTLKHMDKEMIYLNIFCGRGGLTRMKIIDLIIQVESKVSSFTNPNIQRLNAHKISKKLGCAYNTIRYHLKILNGNVGFLNKSNKKYSPKYTISNIFDEKLYSKIKNIIQSFEELQNINQISKAKYYIYKNKFLK